MIWLYPNVFPLATNGTEGMQMRGKTHDVGAYLLPQFVRHKRTGHFETWMLCAKSATFFFVNFISRA